MESLPTTGTTSDLTAMQRIDIVEARILALGGEKAEGAGSASFAPVKHHFTPGLYAREIFMPAGSIITSRIHKTRHPFVISQGKCLVYLGGENWECLSAPHFGITEPGTRRILVMIEDTVWITFHPTDLSDPEEIENVIIEHRVNPLLENIK